MKHLKLFEGFKEDIDAENMRHEKELIDIHNRHIGSVISTLIDDYDFTKTQKDSNELTYDIDYYNDDDDLIENRIEFTQSLFDELIRVNKKLKIEGLQLYLYYYDYTKQLNAWDHDNIKNISEDFILRIECKSSTSNTTTYQFDQLIQNNIFDNMIGDDVFIIITII